MKILVAHNYYQRRGGEDASYESEIRLLREAGHCVIEYALRNDEILGYSFLEMASLGWRTSWSSRAHEELRRILVREAPDIAHFHNTFPLISPSAYYACHAAGVPVIQTLHNFRLICPEGNLFRSGQVCEECLSHSLLRSIAHGCYRGSRMETAAVAGMLAIHGHRQTWSKQVDLFLVCTDFARKKFLQAGFDETRIRIKPNFIVAAPPARIGEGNTALYIGRLSPEKGPQLLPPAWSKLAAAVPLEIIGDGPLQPLLRSDCARLGLPQIRFSGWLAASKILDRLSAAKFLIVPSTCYEGFPLVIAEAYACGVPVIASGHGGLAEIVRDGYTGLHFTPGDAGDLAAKIAWAWAHPREMEVMGLAARAEFEAKYTAAAALSHLESAYGFALRRHNSIQTREKVQARAAP
ncbi:MAG: glycosyltransferase family 4 protein [Candidatus Acidiferrum sp.]